MSIVSAGRQAISGLLAGTDTVLHECLADRRSDLLRRRCFGWRYRVGRWITVGVVVMAVGCGSGAPGAALVALTGTVTAGPTCPVERPDQPCPPVPVAGSVDALRSGGGSAGRATIDADGRFTIELPPGSYTLRVLHDGPFPACPDTAITLERDAPRTVDFSCDTGIR